MHRIRISQFVVALALMITLVAAVPAAAAPMADVLLGSGQVQWVPQQQFAGYQLTVSGPNGVVERSFGADDSLLFDLASMAGDVDGQYNWELRATPILNDEARSILAASRANGSAGERVRPDSLPPRSSLIQSGTFRVQDGLIVQPQDEEPQTDLRASGAGGPHSTHGAVESISAADQVFPDDVIIQGSVCVGFDCVNNENFGFDTIRLKENNTRIKFEDTSVGSFPTTDWQLTANDSASGGQNKFAIEDVTAGRVPFTIEGSSPSNSLYVDSTGNIGMGTSTPVLQLHVKDGNTPSLRLEQDTSSGFAAQTWDLAGNETNFFVRDATNGSRLPLRIRPGAPTSSIDIASDGDVGVGTAAPSAPLHVLRSSGDAKVQVEETSGTAQQRTLLQLTNNGGNEFRMTDNSTGVTWLFQNTGGNFRFTDAGDGANEFILTQSGNLTITGELVTNGPQCGSATPCDGVFHPSYQVPSIEEHAAQMWASSYLPAIGPTRPSSPLNVAQKIGGILNELEKAHIYIEQLNNRLKEKDQQIQRLAERFEGLEVAPKSHH